MNQRLTKVICAGLVTAWCIAGCHIAEAPKGMSGEEAKAAIDRMSPQQKIKAIANSPMPGGQKQIEFDKIEKETGVKASDVLGGNMGSPGAGAPSAPPAPK
jgi:hypothetical protein